MTNNLYNIADTLRENKDKIRQDLSEILQDQTLLENDAWIDMYLNSIDEEKMNDNIDLMKGKLTDDTANAVDTINSLYSSSYNKKKVGEVFTPDSTSSAMLDMLFNDEFRSQYLEHDAYLKNILKNILETNQTVIDPFCGSGRLLTQVVSYKTERNSEIENARSIVLSNIHGMEYTARNLLSAYVKLDHTNQHEIDKRVIKGNTYNDLNNHTSKLTGQGKLWIYNGPYADVKQKNKTLNNSAESTIDNNSKLLQFNNEYYKKEFAASDKVVIENAKPGDMVICFRPITYRTQRTKEAEAYRQWQKSKLHILVLKVMPQKAMPGVQQATEIMLGVVKEQNDTKVYPTLFEQTFSKGDVARYQKPLPTNGEWFFDLDSEHSVQIRDAVLSSVTPIKREHWLRSEKSPDTTKATDTDTPTGTNKNKYFIGWEGDVNYRYGGQTFMKGRSKVIFMYNQRPYAGLEAGIKTENYKTPVLGRSILDADGELSVVNLGAKPYIVIDFGDSDVPQNKIKAKEQYEFWTGKIGSMIIAQRKNAKALDPYWFNDGIIGIVKNLRLDKSTQKWIDELQIGVSDV
jgi:hypothetical protein